MQRLECPLLALLTVLGACGTPPTTPDPATDPDQAAALRARYAGPPAQWPAPHIDPTVAFVELGPPPPAPDADDDARTAAAVALGRTLFFDPRLSGTGQMACVSCHDAELGWGDGRATSFGHGLRQLRRNAPSLLNVAFGQRFFWDGRAASLADQALAVFENPDEMHSSGPAIVALLAQSRGYRALFAAAFAEAEPTLPRTLAALAAFERTIVSDGSSAFDRFLAGETGAMSDAAVAGLHLFRTKARCANCHHGPLLTDGGFHDLGLSYYGRQLEDLGRYRVTGAPADIGRFKTPSLRNVARTGPYMHNGLFDLPGIVNMYDHGMVTLRRGADQQDDSRFPTKSPLLQPLELTADEKQQLLAFLDALTERRRRVRPPQLPALDDL